MYVVDQSPAAESRYRMRFYIDPRQLTMTSGESFVIGYAYDGSSKQVIEIALRYYSGSYYLGLGVYNDAQAYRGLPWKAISSAVHYLELDWQAASAAGANDGSITIWIDGVQSGLLSGLDNDTLRIESFRLGALLGIDPGTHGQLFLDAFESRRQTMIGP